ncbi:hypothetical protein MTO96_007217 [Rhipicephalus appendiculatus]
MRLALLLIASLPLLGTVAGHAPRGGYYGGYDDGYDGDGVVPKSEYRRYRKLAQAIVLRESGEYKVRHLRRILRLRWLSTCGRRPPTPQGVSKCWHDHRKQTITCNAHVSVNRFLGLSRIVRKNCWYNNGWRPTWGAMADHYAVRLGRLLGVR